MISGKIQVLRKLCLYIDIKTYENEYEKQYELQKGISESQLVSSEGRDENERDSLNLDKPKKQAIEIFKEYLSSNADKQVILPYEVHNKIYQIFGCEPLTTKSTPSQSKYTVAHSDPRNSTDFDTTRMC